MEDMLHLEGILNVCLIMCDKKNSILFTDTECVVLSSSYKLPDENHVLLRVLRENNMYNVDLKNVVPLGAVKSTWPVKHVVNKAHSHGNPQQALKDKGVINSDFSRHITGTISFLSDFAKINGGYVAFGGNLKCVAKAFEQALEQGATSLSDPKELDELDEVYAISA
nr:ribonuclease H-like domain-containing protein [Tanacetum cinerariifolium]